MQRASALAAGWLLRGGALLVLGAAAYSTTILAVADHLSRSSTPADRQRAVQLAPRSGLVRERLAESLDDPVSELQRAVALEPANAKYWEQLGSQAEIAGDFGLAEHALLEAAERSRLFQPRYLLAQYYFRRGDRAAFVRWSHAAFDVAPGNVAPLLDLAWRLTGDTLADQAMTARPLIARQIVTFLVEHGAAGAARKPAQHLAEIGGADDLGALLGYTSEVLATANIEAATSVWNTLCLRHVIPYHAGDAVTNADFAHAPFAGGFDWHFEPPEGVLLRPSSGALNIIFSGSQPETCVLAWQYLPLHRGRPIQVLGDLPLGLNWAFFVPEPGAWIPWSGNGAAPADVSRLALMYRRPSGVPRLQGTVTVPPVKVEERP